MKMISKCIFSIVITLSTAVAVVGAADIVDLSSSSIEDVVYGGGTDSRVPWVIAAYHGPCYNCVYDSLTLIFLALNLKGS